LRDSAHGGCEAEYLRRAIELAENDTGLYERGVSLGVHANAAHLRKIDQQSTFAGRMTRKAVPSSADRNQELMVASEGDGTDHVVGIRAARNQCGPAVEGAVPHLARGVILRLFRQEESACESCSQVFDIGRSQAAAGSVNEPRPNRSRGSQ
jgi:hypothetical protein